MHLGGGPAQLLHDGGDLGGLVELVPVEVHLVRRELGDDVPDSVDGREAQVGVGVRLQGALADDGALTLVLEVALHLLGVDEPAHRRHVRLLHGQHHVVVEGLAEALDEHVVRRQPGAADAEPRHPHDVADVVEQRPVDALALGDGLQVGLEGLLDLAPLGLRQVAGLAAVPEHPDPRLEGGHAVEHRGPGGPARLPQQRVHRPVGVVQVQREVVVLVDLGEVGDLGEVATQVAPDERAHVVLRQCLAPPQQRQARAEPLEVPGVVPDVGLVEVVDVEDQSTVGVHVGAEVLRVQVAVDPDLAAALVDPGVLFRRDVGVEEAGRAAVERERVDRHLAVLHPEGRRVGLHQRGERLAEGVDDLLLASLVGFRHVGHHAPPVAAGTRCSPWRSGRAGGCGSLVGTRG